MAFMNDSRAIPHQFIPLSYTSNSALVKYQIETEISSDFLIPLFLCFHRVIFPLADEIGSIKRIVPKIIAPAKPNIIIWEEEKCFLNFASIIKTTIQVYLISYYHCSIMLFKMALTVNHLY